MRGRLGEAEAETAGGGLPDAIRKGLAEGVPLGRLAEPCDVANAALFLASEEAEFLTGVCLDVDGGKSIS